MNSFSKLLRQLRKARKWTQAGFAKEVGLTPQQLSRLEAGAILPRALNLAKIAKVLETDLEELRRQYYSDRIAQELHEGGGDLSTLELAREKFLHLWGHQG